MDPNTKLPVTNGSIQKAQKCNNKNSSLCVKLKLFLGSQKSFTWVILFFGHKCTDRSKPNVEIKMMSPYHSVQMSTKRQI